MKAQVINKFGDPSVFELVDIPKPTLKRTKNVIFLYAPDGCGSEK